MYLSREVFVADEGTLKVFFASIVEEQVTLCECNALEASVSVTTVSICWSRWMCTSVKSKKTETF